MSEQPRRRRRQPQIIQPQKTDYSAMIWIGVGILVFVIALMIISGDSSSSSSSYSSSGSYNRTKSSSSSSNYDRYYSNDEIKDFVNSYKNKW